MLFHEGESRSFMVGEAGAMMSQEELRRRIEEADSLFGVVGATEVDGDGEERDEAVDVVSTAGRVPHRVKAAKRRDSVRVSVRRSMRLIQRDHGAVAAGFGHHETAEADEGSVFQVKEIVLKKGRRSKMFLAPPEVAAQEG